MVINIIGFVNVQVTAYILNKRLVFELEWFYSCPVKMSRRESVAKVRKSVQNSISRRILPRSGPMV